MGFGQFVEGAFEPGEQTLAFRQGWLRFFPGRHFFEGQFVEYVFPHLWVLEDFVQRSESFKVEVALVFLGGMTIQAILLEQGPDLAIEISSGGKAGQEGRENEQEDPAQRADRYFEESVAMVE